MNKIISSSDMKLVEGGSFWMGKTPEQNNLVDQSEKPTKVTVHTFLMSKFLVTQGEWTSIMGNNPSSNKGSRRPVETISFCDAVEFCNRLSVKEGLNECYSQITAKKAGFFFELIGKTEELIICDFNIDGYRLPTEAEWEYAARGGKESKGYVFSGSNDLDEVGWYNYDNDQRRAVLQGSAEIGLKKANELGIYDMSGNVFEWCFSQSCDYSRVGKKAPYHRTRGGCYFTHKNLCKVSEHYTAESEGDGMVGFRVVRTVM